MKSIKYTPWLLAIVILIAACSSAPVTTPAPTAEPATPLPLPPTAAVAAPTTAANPAEVNGDMLFRVSCAGCHGPDGAGKNFEKDGQKIQTPSLAWADLVKLYSGDASRGTPEQQAILAITKGQDETGADLNAMMPRWDKLSAGQLDSLVAYIKAGPADVTALSGPAADLKGQALFEAACAACHGADGAGKKFEKDSQNIETPSIKWGDLTKLYADHADRGTPEVQAGLAIVKGQDETGADLNAMMPRWTILSQAQVDSLVEYLKTLK